MKDKTAEIRIKSGNPRSPFPLRKGEPFKYPMEKENFEKWIRQGLADTFAKDYDITIEYKDS
jgi:hypothetical protein